jgi:8-oxo-dGTP pyrophosphatase MutT (NUDIX family)
VDYLPENAEVGVGLALKDPNGNYLFFLAGSRHRLGASEIFYAGVGGHLEAGEDLLACGRREAKEEIGAEIVYESSNRAPLYISEGKTTTPMTVSDTIKPMAIFEMIHPAGSPKAGGSIIL